MLANRMRMAAAGVGGGAVGDWWLSGGIDSADVVSAYQAKGAASLAASLLDLENSNDLTENGSVTWASGTGWSVFSSANYISSTASFASGTNARTVIVRFVSDSNYTQRQNIVGLSNTAPVDLKGWSLTPELAARYFGGNTIWANYGSADGGVFAVTYSGGTTANVIGYLDGSSLSSSSRSDITPNTESGLTIGHAVSGTAAFTFTGSIQALAIYSTALSAGEVSSVSTAMAAL